MAESLLAFQHQAQLWKSKQESLVPPSQCRSQEGLNSGNCTTDEALDSRELAARFASLRMKGQNWQLGKSSLGLQTGKKLIWKAHNEKKLYRMPPYYLHYCFSVGEMHFI